MAEQGGPMASLEAALAHTAALLDEDPALAAEQAEEIIRSVGPHPLAQLMLARAHRLNGAVNEALTILQPLTAQQTQWPAAHFEHGIAQAQAGAHDQAAKAFSQATTLDPALPDAWLWLAEAQSRAGDETAAQNARLQHVEAASRHPLLMQAASALAEDRLPEAEHLLRERLQAWPNDIAAIRMLAEVAARLDRGEDARALLRRALALAPRFEAARLNHALLLHRANESEAALAEVESLLSRNAEDAAALNLKAAILARSGEYAAANAIYAELLQQQPDHPKLWLSHGHTLKTAGDSDASVAAYRNAVRIDPAFGEAWWSLANLKTFRFDATDIATMQAQLARKNLPDEHRYHLDFALGKALEDAGEHADSFAHYAAGNALRRQHVPYDADETHARLQRVREQYTAEFFAARAGSGCEAPDPIFIVGLPRAGSTLIEQILSSHSQVEGTMELPEVISLARELRQQGERGAEAPYHERVAALDASQLRELGERYLERTRIHRKEGKPFFIDKMPNNFAHLGLIRLMLPNAKIIDARRNPLACCFSAFKQHFARGQDFSYDLDDLGRYYRDYVATMAHFDHVQPSRIHRVIYEQVVEDTEAEVRALLAYCGLPWEDACLRFHENRRAVRTASSEQVRRPINRDGLSQWTHYEPWLAPLKEALGDVLAQYPAVPEALSANTGRFDA